MRSRSGPRRREEAAHRAELRASDEAWERDLAAMGDAGSA